MRAAVESAGAQLLPSRTQLERWRIVEIGQPDHKPLTVIAAAPASAGPPSSRAAAVMLLAALRSDLTTAGPNCPPDP